MTRTDADLEALEELRRREEWTYSDLADQIEKITGVRRRRDDWLDICKSSTRPNVRTRTLIRQVLAQYNVPPKWTRPHVPREPTAVETTPARRQAKSPLGRQRASRVASAVSSWSLPAGSDPVPSPAVVEAFIKGYVRLCAKHGVIADPDGSVASAVYRVDLENRRYLSVSQLAEYLGWTIWKTRGWLGRNPDVRRSREGKTLIIWRRDVDHQLDANAANPAHARSRSAVRGTR